MEKKKPNTLMDAWLDAHEPTDKDTEAANPQWAFTPFDGLNPADYSKTDYRKTQKFLTGESDDFFSWLERNDLVDKDSQLTQAESRMYPAHLKISSRIMADIDLHGLTLSEALTSLQWFIEGAFKKNLKVVKVIHGKGIHSKGPSKLKRAVYAWLQNEGKAFVRCTKTAESEHGGSGATIVWLR